MYSDGEVAALLKLGENGPLTLLPLLATLLQLDGPAPDDPEPAGAAGLDGRLLLASAEPAGLLSDKYSATCLF